MGKKIFAFIGSRSSKKKTYSFVEEILMQLNYVEEIEYQIMTLNDFDIKPCIGCESCFAEGKCIQQDGLMFLEEKILHSDIFIFAAPVYMQGMPGEVKNIIDRLATWAHTFRLAGKNVILVSTCDTNGHTSVVDDLHLKLLYMGARIVDKYVGANVIPEDLEIDTKLVLLKNIEKQLPELVKETVQKCNERIETNRFQESLFERYHGIFSSSKDGDYITGETRYWIESGLLDCQSYEEYLRSIESKGTY